MSSECAFSSYTNVSINSTKNTSSEQNAPDSQDEMFLVNKAANGDQPAFALLVGRYREKLYRVIYWMVYHEEDTWDLLQDTFVHAYQSLPKLKDQSIFGSWIVKIAINLSINHLKKKQRMHKNQEKILRETRQDVMDSPQTKLEQEESQERLFQLISQLPSKQRTVLILCDIEGYSYKKIADILQCNIGTVMSRLFYARNFIRQNFG